MLHSSPAKKGFLIHSLRSASDIFSNPILAGTFIPGLIPQTDIWHALYEFLSSLRDKHFSDTHSDV